MEETNLSRESTPGVPVTEQQEYSLGVCVTCVKVLVCIVEAWMCSTTLSMRGLGPVRKPSLSLKHERRTKRNVKYSVKTSPMKQGVTQAD